MKKKMSDAVQDPDGLIYFGWAVGTNYYILGWTRKFDFVREQLEQLCPFEITFLRSFQIARAPIVTNAIRRTWRDHCFLQKPWYVLVNEEVQAALDVLDWLPKVKQPAGFWNHLLDDIEVEWIKKCALRVGQGKGMNDTPDNEE